MRITSIKMLDTSSLSHFVSIFGDKINKKMKSFIVLAVLVALAVAAPVEQLNERNAVVLRNDFDNLGTDSFSYRAETSNGITLIADAVLESIPLPEGGNTEGLVVRGEYSYTAPDGRLYRVQYIADKDGFRPIGEHIPA